MSRAIYLVCLSLFLAFLSGCSEKVIQTYHVHLSWRIGLKHRFKQGFVMKKASILLPKPVEVMGSGEEDFLSFIANRRR